MIASDKRFDIAAKCDLTKFNKIDKRILDMTNEEKIVDEEEKKETVSMEDNDTHEEVKEEEAVQKEEAPVEDEGVSTDDNNEEPETEEDDIEVLKSRIAELEKANEELQNELAECKKPNDDEEMVSKKECEKRVSGMQASMQKQINEHLNQLKAKDEEIRTVRAELSSLSSKLEEATKELTEKSSALVEKENALAMLNAGVNSPCEELPTMNDGLAKCATPKDKVDFLKSGKYVR